MLPDDITFDSPGSDLADWDVASAADSSSCSSSVFSVNSVVENAVVEAVDRNTEFQLAEWSRRQELVATCLHLKVGEGGVSLAQAARTLGEPQANLCRYLRAYREGGPEALRPGVSTGRRLKYDLTVAEKQALRLETLKRNSFALAVEWFPKNPACSVATRALILAELDKAARDKREPAWPVSLRRAGAVSEEERALFRGAKSFMSLEHCDRRGLFFIDETGNRIAMAPNVLWESDDMSLNEPFKFSCPETGVMKVGRQTLNTIDVFSAFWVAGQPIGRPRDAYRVEDIADHMLGCCEAHGMPLHWRLERGVWENDFVKGIVLSDKLDAAGQPKRWGGLSALFRIHFTFKSRGKGTVESSFNLLQDLIAHGSTSIGRTRGEFERATSLFLKAQKGDPEALAHFWDIVTAADGLVEAMIAFNQRPKKRRAHGRDLVVPADLFQSAPRREIPAAERWRFCPVKKEATVRQGHIECVVDHYPLPFRFRVNGAQDGLYLSHGHRVLIAFHPGRPEEGCHVFNAEGQNEKNRDGYRFAERLLLAPFAEDAPQFHLSPHERDLHARKNANAAVRTEFRGISKAGQPIIRRAESRDGYGARQANFSAPQPATRNPEPETPSDLSLSPKPTIRTRPAPDYDAELAALEHEEREAQLRGDLLTT